MCAADPEPPGLPPATRIDGVPWLEPYPEQWLEALCGASPGPRARYGARQATGLRFIIALQRLPPDQRAALVLRDVSGFSRCEAAAMLGTSEATLARWLARARASLDAAAAVRRECAAVRDAQAERALTGEFADAFERRELERVVALLSDDAWLTLPPATGVYVGVEAIRGVLSRPRPGDVRLLPIRANGQPAFGHYERGPGAPGFHLTGLVGLELAGDRISTIVHFAAGNLPPQLELPRQLDAQPPAQRQLGSGS